MTDLHLYRGDCIDIMRELPEASIDAIVTDPPYELGFMGKEWDGTGIAYSQDTWGAALRVLKPGGHLLAFGGTRTHHRMMVAIEDSGFVIRDTLSWLYGTGFPKSHNVGEGWGTALKPAWEPIVLARKPFTGTVAANVMEHGTGALNIEAARIGTERRINGAGSLGAHGIYGTMDRNDSSTEVEGRWPANVAFDEEAATLLDEQAGDKPAGVAVQRNGGGRGIFSGIDPKSVSGGEPAPDVGYGGGGGPSRFFYTSRCSTEAGPSSASTKNRATSTSPATVSRAAPPDRGIMIVGGHTR